MTTTIETGPLLQAALGLRGIRWPVLPLHTPFDGVCDCPETTRLAECRAGQASTHAQRRGRCLDRPEAIRRLVVDVAARERRHRPRRRWPGGHRARLIEWHAEFIARGLPKTLTFNSGGGDGHTHYLYARTPGCPLERITESGKYDILSCGYAVMPPSLHASGREYAWL